MLTVWRITRRKLRFHHRFTAQNWSPREWHYNDVPDWLEFIKVLTRGVRSMAAGSMCSAEISEKEKQTVKSSGAYSGFNLWLCSISRLWLYQFPKWINPWVVVIGITCINTCILFHSLQIWRFHSVSSLHYIMTALKCLISKRNVMFSVHHSHTQVQMFKLYFHITFITYFTDLFNLHLCIIRNIQHLVQQLILQ